MKKELKDYLHLYLGCEFDTPEGVLKLNAVYEDNEPVFYDSIKGFPLDKIKPILRPLSDMTEEEALELCQLSSPTAWGDFRFKKWVAKLDPKSDKSWKAYDVTNENCNYSFVVDLIDGDITIYDESDCDPTLLNGNYRFWYLTKCFDIFGLIEAGVAIDKTTYS